MKWKENEKGEEKEAVTLIKKGRYSVIKEGKEKYHALRIFLFIFLCFHNRIRICHEEESESKFFSLTS